MRLIPQIMINRVKKLSLSAFGFIIPLCRQFIIDFYIANLLYKNF